MRGPLLFPRLACLFMSDLVVFALFGAGLLVAVGMGEILRAKARWKPEASRRFVHALTGVLVALCPLWFTRPDGVYLLAGLFVVVNFWAIPRHVFPGMHGIQRRSWGTVTFPLALLFALATCWSLDVERLYILQLSFLILALSDPLASAVGMSMRRPGVFSVGINEKSVAGSLTFFLSAFCLTLGALTVLGGHGLTVAGTVAAAFVVAMLTTGAEALASSGWDNFFVVVAAIVPLTMLHAEPEAAGLLVVAVLIAAVFSGVAYTVRFLDRSGALAAAGLAFCVVVLGPAWAMPGVTFFVLSSLLSKLGRRRKAPAAGLAEKGSRRDAGQVYANGGVAWVLLVAYVFVPVDALYWGYVGAFAAAAADTWGTEVGTLTQGPTRLIWSGRRVPPGTSGGVSVLGTLGAVAGAATVFLSMLPVAEGRVAELGVGAAAVAVIGGGVGAALVDSLLGATAQALYRDAGGYLTERSGEGGNALVRGWHWLTNDRVNLACTLTGALLPAAFVALR